jgi:major membrane immunogen (membrane-anchored lipoprotein)
MKRFGIVAALAASGLLVAACGGGGTSHATCKDESSTMAYVQKWQSDLTAAATSGKMDATKIMEWQKKMTDEMGKLKPNDWGGLCTVLDTLKKDAGF